MIVANFEMGDNEVYTQSITQWDYGRVLRIQGLDLPSVVELHFSINCNDECTVTAIGLKNGEFTEVDIPDKLLQQKMI